MNNDDLVAEGYGVEAPGPDTDPVMWTVVVGGGRGRTLKAVNEAEAWAMAQADYERRMPP